jgi:hypothetical protein
VIFSVGTAQLLYAQDCQGQPQVMESTPIRASKGTGSRDACFFKACTCAGGFQIFARDIKFVLACTKTLINSLAIFRQLVATFRKLPMALKMVLEAACDIELF